MAQFLQKIIGLAKTALIMIIGSIGWMLLAAIILLGFSFSWYRFDEARSTEHGI